MEGEEEKRQQNLVMVNLEKVGTGSCSIFTPISFFITQFLLLFPRDTNRSP